MDGAYRNDILSTSDPRAWERLVEPSSQTPSPPAVEVVAAEAAIQVGQEGQGASPSTLQYTTVPTAVDIERVRSRLVLLRDSMLASEQPHAAGKGVSSIFDDFKTKNSTRSSRWDGWQTVPPWSVCSLPGCPLAEVGQQRLLFTTYCVDPGFSFVLLGPRFRRDLAFNSRGGEWHLQMDKDEHALVVACKSPSFAPPFVPHPTSRNFQVLRHISSRITPWEQH